MAHHRSGSPMDADASDDDGDDDYFRRVVAAAGVLCVGFVYREPSRRRHTSGWGGRIRVDYYLNGSPDVIYDKIRMSSDAFRRLSSILEERGLLHPTINLNVDEQLFIFLTILCQNQTNREAQDHWQRSGSTVSEYFSKVLEAVCRLKVDFIRHPDFTAIDPHIIAGGNKYSPWFDDCVGALDGTHVPCVPPRETAELYRNRKGYFSLNVLAVCSFDMRFTYMLSGWEGSAHDARVLASALDHPRKRFPVPPPGKFYLVDSGYANNGCFMAPYRGTTYHLQEYRNRRGRGFRSERELFNYTHSSLRNVIERTFGVWKARFRILKTINRYPIEKQIKVPVACAIIHNFIHMYRNGDRLLDQYSQDGVPVDDIDPQNVEDDINDNNNHEGQPLNNEPELEMNALRDARAHTMWAVYRNRHAG